MRELEVRFDPAFHEALGLHALLEEESGLLSLAAAGTSVEMALTSAQVTALAADIDVAMTVEPPAPKRGPDGIGIEATYVGPDGRRAQVSAWSPRASDYAGALTPIASSYRLALELAPDADWAHRLECLHAYLDVGLPVRRLAGEPPTLRIFGSLSVLDEVPLRAAFGDLPPGPLVVDMSECGVVATLLTNAFRRLVTGRTVRWIANDAALQVLKRLSLDPETVEHRTVPPE